MGGIGGISYTENFCVTLVYLSVGLHILKNVALHVVWVLCPLFLADTTDELTVLNSEKEDPLLHMQLCCLFVYATVLFIGFLYQQCNKFCYMASNFPKTRIPKK